LSALGVGAEAAMAAEGERGPAHVGDRSTSPTLLPPINGEGWQVVTTGGRRRATNVAAQSC
jgi:hypothetical protein